MFVLLVIPSADIDESGPTYAKLSQSVHENLLTTNVEVLVCELMQKICFNLLA